MTTFPQDFQVLDINPEQDEAEAVSLFEAESGKTLYPAQSERIAISVFTKLHTLFKSSVNEAFKNLLLPYAKGIFLDIFGALLGCERLAASPAKSTLRVNLYEPFGFDKIIPAGTEIETKDGEYIFITDSDLIIPAGDISGEVEITSSLAGSALNYRQNEITNIIQNYEYVESVTNISDAVGGSNEEDDDSYRQRLYIAAEKSSTAGPKLAYKYYAMSADKSITDVQVECVQENAKIIFAENTYTEENGKIENEKISADIDYISGVFNITLKEQGLSFSVIIPPCAKINIYALTENGTPSEEIINKIYAEINTDERRPLSDMVVVSGAEERTFSVNGTVYIMTNADYDSTVMAVKSAVNNYLDNIRKKLNQSVFPSEITSVIQNVSGVKYVILESPNILNASTKIYYNGTIEELNFERG